MSDHELVVHYKNSPEKYFVAELYKRYAHLIFAMCIYYFDNKEYAKKITMEIFEKLTDDLKKREVENFKEWLTFAARNYCISELRMLQLEQKLKTTEPE